MSVRRTEEPEIWADVIKKIVFQTAYRQLGIVSLYCPIDVAAQAIDILSSGGMGKWRWLIENRVLVWEEVPVDSALFIHLYVFGGKLRRKNTVFVRQGFWRMYFVEAGLRLFDKSIVGRILSKI
jgi:hypothetical protein